MKHFVAVESSSGRLIYVCAPDKESAYKLVGVQLLGMELEGLDTGNVDIDLYEVTIKDKPTAYYLTEE